MPTVLVVEDEPLIRMAVIDTLEDAGFHVIEAATADDALGIIERQHVHLLFTDIQMRGELSGVDLAHAVAHRFPEAGIIVSSGRLNPADLVLPSTAEFFPKPYDFAMIVSRLRALSIN